MFTLPVTTGRLILSKFLVALVTVSVTCLLSIGGMWLVILNLDRTNLLAYALDQLSNLRAEDWLTLALCVLAVFSGFGMKLAQVYLACAIGHQAKKHRVLLAVVCDLLVLSADWLFFYYMPGYSWAGSRWLTFVLPSAGLTLLPSLVLFRLVRRIHEEFKIDNGVV